MSKHPKTPPQSPLKGEPPTLTPVPRRGDERRRVAPRRQSPSLSASSSSESEGEAKDENASYDDDGGSLDVSIGGVDIDDGGQARSRNDSFGSLSTMSFESLKSTGVSDEKEAEKKEEGRERSLDSSVSRYSRRIRKSVSYENCDDSGEEKKPKKKKATKKKATKKKKAKEEEVYNSEKGNDDNNDHDEGVHSDTKRTRGRSTTSRGSKSSHASKGQRLYICDCKDEIYQGMYEVFRIATNYEKNAPLLTKTGMD